MRAVPISVHWEMQIFLITIYITSRNKQAAANPIPEEEMNQMKKSINLVLNLRYSFQHGGLPNLLRDLSDDCEETEFYNMLIPNKISETKKIFKQAEALVKLLPQPTIVCSEMEK